MRRRGQKRDEEKEEEEEERAENIRRSSVMVSIFTAVALNENHKGPASWVE